MVGLFGTVLGIFNSFPGFAWERPAHMALVDELPEALIPFCLGLLVTLQAACTHAYLSTRLEALRLDLRTASLALSNTLARH